MLRRGAEAESERNKQLAARIEFDKSGEQYLSKRARMEREIAKATNEAAAAGVGQAELGSASPASAKSSRRKTPQA